MTTTPTPAIEAGISDAQVEAACEEFYGIKWVLGADTDACAQAVDALNEAEGHFDYGKTLSKETERPRMKRALVASRRSSEAASSGVRDGWRVKALVWTTERSDFTNYWFADTSYGRLQIGLSDEHLQRSDSDKHYRASHPLGLKLNGWFRALEDAKAWFQADYERRILSGLDAPSAPPEPSGASQGEGWQTIDSAPRDGTEVDLWLAPLSEDGKPLTPCRVPNAHYHCAEWLIWGGDPEIGWIAITHRITHWRLPPAPPVTGASS